MRAVFSLCLAMILWSWSAQAQECDANYTIAEGDSLTKIARDSYGDRSRWEFIFYSNRDAIGDDPSLIRTGRTIFIPCIGGGPREIDFEQAAEEAADLTLLTAGDYRPFTDQALPNGGMITHIVQAAFSEGPDFPSYRIDWVNDWSSHLTPLLERRLFDMGFPWLKPDCAQMDSLSESMQFRCRAFDFSEPMFEMLVVYFKKASDPFVPESIEDIRGLRLCRPDGYYTFDLEQSGLNIPGDTTLVRPDAVADCFEALMAGEVDLVTINSFTGRDALRDLGLEGEVEALQPLSTVQGLHMVVHRTHPRGEILMHQFNEALAELERKGRLEEIIADHLARYYDLS